MSIKVKHVKVVPARIGSKVMDMGTFKLFNFLKFISKNCIFLGGMEGGGKIKKINFLETGSTSFYEKTHEKSMELIEKKILNFLDKQ